MPQTCPHSLPLLNKGGFCYSGWTHLSLTLQIWYVSKSFWLPEKGINNLTVFHHFRCHCLSWSDHPRYLSGFLSRTALPASALAPLQVWFHTASMTQNTYDLFCLKHIHIVPIQKAKFIIMASEIAEGMPTCVWPLWLPILVLSAGFLLSASCLSLGHSPVFCFRVLLCFRSLCLECSLHRHLHGLTSS